jgi:hypothetical protein
MAGMENLKGVPKKPCDEGHFMTMTFLGPTRYFSSEARSILCRFARKNAYSLKD